MSKTKKIVLIVLEAIGGLEFIVGLSEINSSVSDSTMSMIVGLLFIILTPLIMYIISNNKEEDKLVDGKIVCSKCGSNNISIQIVSQNKNSGCLTIFFYIFLALTIIGIPIMIIILLLKGKKQIHKKYCICQNCGHSWNI